jgi:acetolactate decarboxylase
MKKMFCALALLILFVSLVFQGCNSPSRSHEILYQTSTLNALMEGVYDGSITLTELKQNGDFGVGTFAGLDGEMIVLNGEIYQVRVDGKIYKPEDSIGTPFAAVTFFEADQTFTTENVASSEQLINILDSKLQTHNIFYAVKIEGLFNHMKTRSVPRQSKPYPPLAKVSQSVFEFDNIEGTIVGLRCPAYASGVNLPGYHFHFISKDKQSGGHVIDFQIQNAKTEIDATPGFYMELPANMDFYRIDLTGNKQDDLNKVEKGVTGK